MDWVEKFGPNGQLWLVLVDGYENLALVDTTPQNVEGDTKFIWSMKAMVLGGAADSVEEAQRLAEQTLKFIGYRQMV